MQQIFFVLLLLLTIFTVYLADQRKNMATYLISTALLVALATSIQVSGIDILTQVNSTGHFIYSSQTSANNPIVQILAVIVWGIAALNVWSLIQTWSKNNWKITG